MRQAEKFKRPIITFVDTPGAYPGLEAEAEGQGQAIAASLALMSSLTVPVIAVVIGEAGSGGALALAVGNRVILMENAVYSVLSPEGFASILWKDAGRADEAAEVMKLTAADLLRLGVADQVIPEPEGGAQNDPKAVFAAVDKALTRHLNQLSKEKDLARPAISKIPRHGRGSGGERDMNGLQILGTGRALPEHVVTNDDLAKIVDTSDEWIVSRTGIKERRFAREGETLTQSRCRPPARPSPGRASGRRTWGCA